MDPQLSARFSGINRLYGQGALERLSRCKVAVIGLGGVGSWLVEALARSGVGALSLMDADDLCISNTNRQLPALDGYYGRNKAEVMAERCRAINPLLDVAVLPVFLTASNLAELLDSGFDLVIDACDSFRSKVELIAWCRRRKQPVLTVGSAGGRIDPTLVRKKLRAEFNFPKNRQRYFGVPAVYSLENVRYLQPDGRVCGLRPALGADAALKLDCGTGLGAATHLTGAFAFAAAGKALEMLLRGVSADTRKYAGCGNGAERVDVSATKQRRFKESGS